MRRLLAITVLALAGCGSPPRPTVVVYVPAPLEAGIRQALTGRDFSVEFVVGDSRALTDAVIGKDDAPRADVLIASSVIDIWRAGDRGALRPLDETFVERAVTGLRDPEGAWAAIGYDPLRIGVMPAAPGTGIATYADLAAPALEGQLCMTTPALPHNRVLIAMLVEALGPKPAERLVRNWVRNFARPPFATERALADALASGDCSVAVVSPEVEVAGLERRTPRPEYGDIQAIGVTRHAAHPDEAQRLVAALLDGFTPDAAAAVDARNIGLAGWRDEEVRRLAERAGYR